MKTDAGADGQTPEAEAEETAPAAAGEEREESPAEQEEERPAAEDSGARENRAAAPAADPELNAMRDRHLRLAAEFDNYRKRTEKERAESWARAQAQLAERLLDPLDDLARVTSLDAEKTSVQAVLEGVQMVERKLLRALEAAGLEPVEADGERFDPELHEALMQTPAETEEEDEMVAQVFQRGYLFKGVLLRPARVAVKQFGG